MLYGLAVAILGIIVSLIIRAIQAPKLKRLAEERRVALEAFTAEHDLQYSFEGNLDFLNKFNDLKVLGKEKGRGIAHVMAADAENMKYGTFQFARQHGNQTVSYTVFYAALNTIKMPECRVYNPNQWVQMSSDKKRARLTHPEDSGFSTSFFIAGPKPSAIHQFLDADMRKAMQNRRGYVFATKGGLMLYYQFGKSVEVEGLKSFLDNGKWLANLFLQKAEAL